MFGLFLDFFPVFSVKYTEVRSTFSHYKEGEGMGEKMRIELSSDGYRLELDPAEKCCVDETPHWHLWKNDDCIGQITIDGIWITFPSTEVKRSIIKQTEELTDSYRYEIADKYNKNCSLHSATA